MRRVSRERRRTESEEEEERMSDEECLSFTLGIVANLHKNRAKGFNGAKQDGGNEEATDQLCCSTLTTNTNSAPKYNYYIFILYSP